MRLLSDLRRIFGDADALHTETILERLHHGEKYGLEADAPWNDLRGKPLGDRGLASMLKKYDIKSKKVWSNSESKQGYRREPLWEAWQRYLPSTPESPAGAEGPEGANADAGLDRPDQGGEVDPKSCPGSSGPSAPSVPADPEARSGVRCVACAFYDAPDRFCYHADIDRPIANPDRSRTCPHFRVPVPSPADRRTLR